MSIAYAELQVTTNFSFLQGASHAEELALAAVGLGYRAIAVTDRNTVAGVVRAFRASRKTGMRVLVGCRLDLTDGPSLLCWPTDRAAYTRLCQLLTIGKMRAPKGECFLTRADVAAHAEGQVLAVLPPDPMDGAWPADLRDYRARFGKGLHVALTHRYQGDDLRRMTRLAAQAAELRLPTLATNDVHYHHPARRPLQDVMTCIRDGVTIQTAGWRLFANAERHLKAPQEMARLFYRFPEAVARTVEITERCRFDLSELSHEYPDEVAPGGDPQRLLEELTWAGAARHWPDGIPEKHAALIRKELALIGEMGFAPFFLTVEDIVRFARGRGILCQGRGSAANSVVCYCLDITGVDPDKNNLLFERFISKARGEPPDIDVDFEHERREEVFQYIYGKYGRDRAGIAATVICYRARGAIRDVGKAMGLSLDMVDRLAKSVWGWGHEAVADERVRELGLDPDDPLLHRTLDLARELIGFPRHLSQHVGGFVITRGPLWELSPVANAAMDGRTTIEWDKDDIETLNILKVDVLALGMLTCLRKGFDLLRRHYGRDLHPKTVPTDDPRVYDMLCRADSLGVFQVESRAQMTMLPRLRPRNFYDLVIEVAIVRPGPIQGDMVHPYLRRRNKLEPVEYPKDELREVLEKTCGVPLFQEQAMRIAIVAAGFSPEKADQLRRAMATFKNTGTLHRFREEFIEGMIGRGYAPDFAERCFKQIEGFGSYGFPESHAAAFAFLVYVSAWVKRFYPDVFCAALLNSQPMGFYAPAQIVRDAREHGVRVLEPDVNASDWDCGLEPMGVRDDQPYSVIPAKAGTQGLQRDTADAAPHDAADGQRRRRASSSPHGGNPWSPAFAGVTGRGGEDREGVRVGPRGLATHAVRLGFRQIKGFREEEALKLMRARAAGPFTSPHDLWRRAGLSAASLELLAQGDCFRSLGLDRRQALWAVGALGEPAPPLLAGLEPAASEPAVSLPAMPMGEHVVEDYRTLSLSLKTHPLALLRPRVAAHHGGSKRHPLVRAEELDHLRHGRRVAVAGLVLVRQRPGSASGVVFVTIEDETGIANLVLMPDLFERYRRHVLAARLMLACGRLEVVGEAPHKVIHLRVEHLEDLSAEMRHLSEAPDHYDPQSMEGGVARADEVRRNTQTDPRDKRKAEAVATLFPDGRNFR